MGLGTRAFLGLAITSVAACHLIAPLDAPPADRGAESAPDAALDARGDVLVDGRPDLSRPDLLVDLTLGDATVCVGGELLCLGACVKSCAGCPGRPIECFACAQNLRENANAVGTCETTSSWCLSGDYTNAYPGAAGEGVHCDCSNRNEKNCVGDKQVCIPAPPPEISGIDDWCLTCGEPGSGGLTCKGGGSCDLKSATCK
jgi:predicted small lipoprotein YifL